MAAKDAERAEQGPRPPGPRAPQRGERTLRGGGSCLGKAPGPRTTPSRLQGLDPAGTCARETRSIRGAAGVRGGVTAGGRLFESSRLRGQNKGEKKKAAGTSIHFPRLPPESPACIRTALRGVNRPLGGDPCGPRPGGGRGNSCDLGAPEAAGPCPRPASPRTGATTWAAGKGREAAPVGPRTAGGQARSRASCSCTSPLDTSLQDNRCVLR